MRITLEHKSGRVLGGINWQPGRALTAWQRRKVARLIPGAIRAMAAVHRQAPWITSTGYMDCIFRTTLRTARPLTIAEGRALVADLKGLTDPIYTIAGAEA